MQIPMEVLTLMAARADFSKGVHPRAGPNIQEGSQFTKVFEEALAETDPLIPDKSPDKAAAEKETAPAIPPEQDRDTDVDKDETLTIGLMGSQNFIVFILEGDKESATTLEVCVDDVKSAETDNITYPADTRSNAVIEHPEQAKKDTDTNTEAETVPIDGSDAKNVISLKEADKTAVNSPEVETHVKNTIHTVEKTAHEADAAKETVSTTGEVTARMPITRTPDRRENEEDSSDFSKKGNLSPLENENDTAPIKGQKEKTYSETANAVRNAAEGEPKMAETTPIPLADGIKPEQFRADQQMKQAASDAPVKTENLFEEMVSRIDTMKTDSLSKMSIQLKPEFLGNVALEISMDAAGLHVKINAADSGVRTMINGQVNALIESLGNKGIEVVEVEVAYTGVDNGAFKESREGQAQSDRPRRNYREAETVDGVAYYTTLPFDTLDYYLDTGVSSVEYRA